MAKKWVVVNNQFRMAAAIELHSQLLPPDKPINELAISGGGWWHVEEPAKKMYLYSSSVDFGVCQEDDLLGALQNTRFSNRFDGFKFYFSHQESLANALIESSLGPIFIYQRKEP